jgi:DNA (cytosine-5)-methyltransferase 1
MRTQKARAASSSPKEGTDQTGMNTVELFCGIGGFRIAADSRAIKTVWANDSCKRACAVYRDRFGSAELHEGDIRKHVDSIPSHDLLSAGFPCQPFSSAGKKEGVRDPRGSLFQVIVDVLRAKRPRFFIMENVKRLLTMEEGFHFATIISSLSELDYQIEWRLVNALHLGLPQNRQRVFIIGSLSGQDKGHCVRLASMHDLNSMSVREQDVISHLDAWTPIEKHGARFPAWGITQRGRFFGADLEMFSAKTEIVPLRKVLQDDVSKDFDFTESTLKWLSNNTEVNRYIGGVEILSNQGGGARMGYTIFGINGVAPTLTSTTSRHYERYKVGDRYRRLTNVEYARIQGFEDDHCRSVSVYDQYALIGNAVPPHMAGWAIDCVLRPGIPLSNIRFDNRQPTLFDYAY